MYAQLADGPPVRALREDGDGRHRSRSQALVILERPRPAPWALRQLAWFARRLRAELLIATVVAYDRGPDDFDRVKAGIAKEDVERVAVRLIEQGISATAEVRMVPRGDQARAAADLADRLDADLVIVLARRAS